MSTTAIKISIRKYIAAFNSARDFSEAEPLFDSLYKEDFTLAAKAYNEDHTKYRVRNVSREQVKEKQSELFSKGGEVTLVHFRKIGIRCVDVEFRLKDDDEDRTVRVVCSVEDGKLASAAQVDTVVSALMERFANDVHMVGALAKFFLWNHEEVLVR